MESYRAITPEAARPLLRYNVGPSGPEFPAWVVSLHREGDTGLALLTASTLREMRTAYSIFCAVAPKVGLSDEASAQLLRVYTAVAGADANGYPADATPRLHGYTKVVMLPPGLVFLTNCDELFELPAPAVCFHPGAPDFAHGVQLSTEEIAQATHPRLLLLDPRHLDQPVDGALMPREWTYIHPRYIAAPWAHPRVDRDLRAMWVPPRDAWDSGQRNYATEWERAAKRLIKEYPDATKYFAAGWSAQQKAGGSPPTAQQKAGGSPPTAQKAAESGALDADMAQLRLTQTIRAFVLRGQVYGSQQMVDAVLERWLLALVNAPGPAASYAPWARVYRRSGPDEAFNNKLAGELREQIVGSASEAGQMVVAILAAVDACLASPPPPSGLRPRCDSKDTGYGSFSMSATPRTARLVRLASCGKALAVALRYSVVISTGQQWALPQSHVDYLYNEYNVRGEGFASPLNARLLGKPGVVICTAFPDTDAAYGSVGDFFGYDFRACPGNWVLNPPFIEELLERAARHVTAQLAWLSARESGTAAGPQTVFFMMPAWKDSEAYRLLHGSLNLVGELALEPGRYHFEDPAGNRVNTRVASIYFALSTELRAGVRAKIETALYHMLN